MALLGLLFTSLAAGAGDWPYWRGPLATGVAPEGDPPVEWSDTENVSWRYRDPGLGFSSPIVWKDQVFITTAIRVLEPGEPEPPPQRYMLGEKEPAHRQQFVVLAVDRETGQERWRRVAREALPHEGHHGRLSSYANMSPVTDGKRVYASFGSQGVYAYDLAGEPVWSRDFNVKMRMYNRFGESSSPALHGDTLVLSFDHQEQSFIVALDSATGEVRWREDRDENTTWTSPHILEHEGKAQVVVAAHNFVRGYDLESGEVLWKVTGMTRSVIPTPVSGHGMVFVASGTNGQAFKAIRLGGSGDLTGTDAEVWSLNKGTPYNPSPLLWGDELYLLKDIMSGNTFLSAFNAHTGEQYYFQNRLPQSYTIKASPVGAGDKIYLCTEEGDVLVLKRGKELEVLAVNSMDEMFLASPAVAGNELFLRSREHLYRIVAK